ncbi:hypothetical protein BS50DRAFT_584236 [Corynespora cassiicola Philippines]|uniref:Uncharacterized protein n=1 Tax=Corynespora cassiicola Philippines TaxID=1448308 RepID=A0A2T2NYY4_CORCC|nr:hypothetical protein BS50DRAFT_584236 [Corynespora cassiicola Philippines]
MYKNKLLHKLALADNRQIRDPDFVKYLQQHQNIRHHPDSQQQHQALPPDARVVPAPKFLPSLPPYILDSVYKFYSPACLATLSLYILTVRVDYLRIYFEQSKPEKWLTTLLEYLPACYFSKETDQVFRLLYDKAYLLLGIIYTTPELCIYTVPYALRLLLQFRIVIEGFSAEERLERLGVKWPDLLMCMAVAVTTAHNNLADIPIRMKRWAEETGIYLYAFNKWEEVFLNALGHRLEFATEAVEREERGGWVDRVGEFWREFNRVRGGELKLPGVY